MAQESPLREELIKEIGEEVREILDRARRDGEGFLKQALRKREERERRRRERMEEDLAVRRRRSLARCELEGRNSLLRLKREEVDRVFDAARERLWRLEAEEPEAFLDLLEHIFRVCRGRLPEGPVRVRIGEGKVDLARRLQGDPDVEAVVEPGLRGVVLETSDGRVHCDGSLEGLLQRLRQEKEAEIEDILFRNGHGGEEE